MKTITTKECTQYIQRCEASIPRVLEENGVFPMRLSGRYYWPVDEVKALVEREPKYARPFRVEGKSFALRSKGQEKEIPKSKREWAVICATAAARMKAGISVGEKERYSDVPVVRFEDVPEWLLRELGL